MNAPLRTLVEDRLTTAGGPPVVVVDLVLAACAGTEPLERVLAGEAPVEDAEDEGEETWGARVYLEAIEVEAFRGIGGRSHLTLVPGPGLTLVVGRNGSGKSSFAEAAELLLTGANRRWQGKSQVWTDGWRNIHSDGQTAISADFAVEGQTASVRATRRWDPSASLEDSSLSVTGGMELNWEAPLSAYRPFLSYSELGSMFNDGPSKLFDALSAILGLDDLVGAKEALRQERLSRERAVRDTGASLAPLLERLAESDDDRAASCHAALSGKDWDLEGVELILAGVSDGAEPAAALALLQELASLPVPDAEATSRAADRLERALADTARHTGTDSGHALTLAGLLETALTFHEGHEPSDCPVCGTPGVMGETWARGTAREIAKLRVAAAEAEAATAEAREAERAARTLVGAPPVSLSRADEVGVEARAALSAWQAWSQAPGSATDLVAHLHGGVEAVRRQAEAVRAAAATERAKREDAWRPLGRNLDAWLGPAARAVEATAALPNLRTAEAWLQDATDDLRRERFAPIAQAAHSHWETLRQQSSVTLEHLGLEGSGGRRRVALDVTIDGVAGAALGVMSQGELNSLALSLFLPRASMPESPFGFVVIDDPVQSMDPAKVDGLALVLGETANDRQVVVFTHDERLAEAVERLRIPAHMLEVTRRARSVVEIRERGSPVQQLISDARAVAKASRMPAEVRGSVVPGLCRQALEAACAQCTRRRRIGRGEPHEEVEASLDAATTLKIRIALALFDDSGKAGDVLSSLNNRHGRWAGDVVQSVDQATHQGYSGDLLELIRNTRRLAEALADGR